MVTSRSCAGFAVAALAVLVGCHLPARHAPQEPHRATTSEDGPTDVPPGVMLAAPAGALDGLRPPQHVVALSSGGLYGAYSAGVLSGWTAAGGRPEFDVVTGTSTGALIAPFAFLGGDYDAQAMKLYTGVRTDDIFKVRAWVTIPFRDSLATSAPLRRLIAAQITPELLQRIATEHKKGRRLYVGTTELRTKRAVIWDMGAIAALPRAEGGPLFRDVLLASASIPGVLPPMAFRLQVDGRPVTEWHVDGSTTAPLFMPPGVFAAATARPDTDPMRATANFYAIVAGKVYPDEGPVRRRILPVLSTSTEAVLSAHCRAELANTYWQSRLAGMRYHMIALRQDAVIHANTAVSFDRQVMTQLYVEGYRDGQAGPGWAYVPPALSPCDGNFTRGGPRLRTVAPAAVPAP
ncbi:MAG: patatin-like phospholipase family protein [Gemmata sp.]